VDWVQQGDVIGGEMWIGVIGGEMWIGFVRFRHWPRAAVGVRRVREWVVARCGWCETSEGVGSGALRLV
jgi:hypothetical protein